MILIGCGDNVAVTPPDAHVVPDAPVDTVPGKPDLVLVDTASSVLITNDMFDVTSCELAEQCIGDIGTRRLLRFDTVTANLGTADLVIGAPPAMGVDEPPFTWSACHDHHHYTGFAIYELLDGDNVIVAGHKQAFCVLDTARVTPGAPTHGYDCSNQGLSVGWSDIYAKTLPCQWIDITDVARGTYTLRVRLDPGEQIDEADRTNNTWEMAVGL